jgi:hypothetical protein
MPSTFQLITNFTNDYWNIARICTYGIGYAYGQYQSLGFEVNADKCIFTLFSYHHYQVCQQF